MSTIERVREIVDPLLRDRGLDLYDIEQHGPVLRVTIDRSGGLDVDDLAEVTRAVSRALDEHDPLPGRYTLEVSSPGLERTLRTPTHYQRAVGDQVAIKTVAGTEGDRRVTGTLEAADAEGIDVHTDAGTRRLTYDQIERARTVFEWGAAPKKKTTTANKAAGS